MPVQAKVSVLLGAGASVDAGLPTTVGMTEAVIERLDDRGQIAVLEFVRHTIAADLAQRETVSGGRWGQVDVAVDVERLFATVELLASRLDQPLAPFVGTWHPGLEKFAGYGHSNAFFARNSFERAIGRIAQRRGAADLARELERFVEGAIARSRGGDVSELVAAARDSMLRSLFGILNIEDPAQVRYLTPLMELLERQRVLTLATLNYDRSVENAATLVGVDCHTGIETWLTTGALDWPDDGVRLLKLHGSIDWVFEGDHYERGKLPRQVIRKVTGAEEKARYEAPAVVFGEGGKLRAEGPFLELLLAWAAQLQTADRLLVVGYSFRDTHVNEIVARWFNEDDDRRIVIVDPTNFEAHGRSSFAASLARVNDVDPDQTPPIPRVVHLSGTAATTLRAGVSEVLRGRDADVAETG